MNKSEWESALNVLEKQQRMIDNFPRLSHACRVMLATVPIRSGLCRMARASHLPVRWRSDPKGKMIPDEIVKSRFIYDPVSGVVASLGGNFYTGHTSRNGYVVLIFRYGGEVHRISAHRLAFFLMTGKWPKEVDHINRIRDDNRWVNLREATRTQNSANLSVSVNNTSGFAGVYWSKKNKQWLAHIKANGVRHYLGGFDLIESAAQAYRIAAVLNFGEFASTELENL